jgi:hypothetical protein
MNNDIQQPFAAGARASARFNVRPETSLKMFSPHSFWTSKRRERRAPQPE